MGFEAPRFSTHVEAFGTTFSGLCSLTTVGKVETSTNPLLLRSFQGFIEQPSWTV